MRLFTKEFAEHVSLTWRKEAVEDPDYRDTYSDSRNVLIIAEYTMKVCQKCKHREQCADLPGICLKLPGILAASVAVMVVVLMFNSTI